MNETERVHGYASRTRRSDRKETAAKMKKMRDWEADAAKHDAFEAYVAQEWERYAVLPELDRILIAKQWLRTVECLERTGHYRKKARKR